MKYIVYGDISWYVVSGLVCNWFVGWSFYVVQILLNFCSQLKRHQLIYKQLQTQTNRIIAPPIQCYTSISSRTFLFNNYDITDRKHFAFSSRLQKWNKKSMEYYGVDYLDEQKNEQNLNPNYF